MRYCYTAGGSPVPDIGGGGKYLPVKAMKFHVEGLVQGVGFRWFVQDSAQKLNLVGFVRNLPDGRVEVHAEGGEDSLQKLLAGLKKGPSHARVSAVGVTEENPSGRFSRFRITV